MRRKHERSEQRLQAPEVAQAERLAGRLQASCRRRVPDCRVMTVLQGGGSSVDLRVGRGHGGPEEQLWVRDLDVDCLATPRAVEDLARVISVWIAREPGERTMGTEVAERASVGGGRR